MQRPAALAVALSIVSFPFLLPHVVEDFHWGIADRIGVPPDALAALVGLVLATQVFGVALAARERRTGLTLIALTGAVWTVGAIWDHGMAVLVFGFGFRGRPMSTVWVMGLTLTQALASATALVALVRGPSGSRAPRPPWPR